MNDITLPPSPNWYLSSILDCHENGKAVAWGCANNIVIGVETNSISGLSFRTIRHAHQEKVLSICFGSGSTGQLLASTGEDGTVHVWNISTLQKTFAYSFDQEKGVLADWLRGEDPPQLYCLTLSTNGRLMRLNTRYESIVGSIILGKPATCISCCPHNSDLVAVGSKSGLIYVVQFHGKPSILYRFRGHDTSIVSISWCPSPRNVFTGEPDDVFLLASGAKDKSVFIWRADQNGRCVVEIPLPTKPVDCKEHRRKLSAAVGDWIAVKWIRPKLLLSTSVWGELLSWDFSEMSTVNDKPNCRLVHAFHARGIFCIAQEPPVRRKTGSDSEDDNEHDTKKEEEEEEEEEEASKVWTLAQDRLVIRCTISRSGGNMDYKIPTQIGAIYSIVSCPVEASHIAFGGRALCLWNLSSSQTNPFDLVTLWQKIQGTITSLAWHPEKENLLAFGTDQGRIGVFDTNVNKPPTLCKPYSGKTVYSLGWGPNGMFGPRLNTKYLYSCIDGKLICHDPCKLTEDPIVIIQKECTEFSWSPGLSCLAVGFENGSLSFFDGNLKLRGTASTMTKRMIYCLVWHPESTDSEQSCSPFKHYLAVASNKAPILIYNLANYRYHCDQLGNGEKSYQVKELVATFRPPGNSSVVCLAWNPHIPEYLVCSSYDRFIQIWNVEKKVLIGTYVIHAAPVLTCMWSPVHPHCIISGSKDGMVRVWNFREQIIIDDQRSAITSEKSDKSKSKKQGKHVTNNKQKNEKEHKNDCQALDSPHADQQATGLTENVTKNCIGNSFEKRADEKQKQRTVSYFGDKAMNSEKLLFNAIANVVNCVLDDNSENEETDSIFPLFNNYQHEFQRSLLDERRQHVENRQFEASAGISVWSDNLKEEVEEAIKQKRLNDHLVSLTPSLSIKMWKETCEAYAHHLAEEGKPLKAASYLLGIHQPHKAIKLLEAADLYHEAYAIARAKLSRDDTTLKQILETWAAYAAGKGQLLKAAYIYVELRDFEKAYKYLARCENAKALEIAADLALLSGDKNLAVTTAEQVIELLMLSKSGHAAARNLIEKFPQLQYKKVQLKVLKELQEKIIGHRKTETDATRTWLEGNSKYGLLENLKACCTYTKDQRESFYSSLRKNVYEEFCKDEGTLWRTVSCEIGMAVLCDDNDKWEHTLNALAAVTQFEKINRQFKNEDDRDTILLEIIRSLDATKPTEPESMFAKNDSRASTCLRAFLCDGLISWLLQEHKRNNAAFDEVHLGVLSLVQELLVDAFDKVTLQYYSQETELAKLKSQLSFALCEMTKEEASEDGNVKQQKVASLTSSLNKLGQEKRVFMLEYLPAPNPVMLYGNANQLASLLPEEGNVREKYLEVLRGASADLFNPVSVSAKEEH